MCIWLFRRRAHWLSYIAYFVLFGIIGGACLALALSPSGLAAMCMLFLMTAAPVGCVACSMSLHMLRDRSRSETVAMTLGYCYGGLLAVFWIFALIH